MRCLCYQIFLILCLPGVCHSSVVSGAFVDERSGPVTPKVERSVQAASADDAEQFLKGLAGSQLIVSQLKTRLQRGVQVFDIEAKRNVDESAWLVHLNLSTSEFRDRSRTYEHEGYQLIIEQGLLTGPKRRWLGVWVQQPAAAVQLKIPEGDLPVSGSTGTV